ncbi:MAG: ComEA family DNA-binding protein [Desulfofustis sp.]|jgi:competence protein ComEA|nr:ComEA family DNA-binding protein [Desulfofustis sp.]
MKMHRVVVSILCSLVLLFSVAGPALSQAAGAKSAAAAAQVAGETVDINRADLEQLATLPGIGEKLAERINAYREENGPFKSVDDLLNVKGVGPKMLEKIKPLITVS